MRSRPHRRAAVRATAHAALVLVVGLGLAGCASIPTSGPVQQGAEVRSERDDPFIRVIARPPRPGLTATEVVQGFLAASASFDDDHAVARAYLAPESRAGWDPLVGTVVYQDGGATVREAATGRVVFSAARTATVSARGEYLAASGTEQTAFRLRQVQGEWRIVDPPPGLLLTRLDVDRAYRTFDLFFPDPSRTVLVPNQVLLPVGPGVSTTLVRALLEGPTPWLAPAVRTAFPAGTALAVDSAPLQDGVVLVDLTEPAAQAVGSEAAALSAQLVWTLRQLSDVSGVAITVEGVPLAVPGAGQVQPRGAWPQVDPDVVGPSASTFLVSGGALVAARDGDLVPVPGAAGTGGTPLTAPAVSVAEDRMAALDGTGTRLLVGPLTADGVLRQVLTGTALTAPTWDVLDTVWTADRRADGSVAVWSVQAAAAPRQAAVDDLPAGRVVTLVVARDGARAAVVVERGGGRVLLLGRVERDDGTVRLAGFRQVAAVLTDVRDVAWGSADTLVVLGRSGSGVLQPVVVDVSGLAVRQLGTVAAEITSVAAAPGLPTLAATVDGRVWQSTGVGWSELAPGRDPTYPG